MFANINTVPKAAGFPMFNGLAGLGAQSSTCRWVNMGPELGWRWVCFRGLAGAIAYKHGSTWRPIPYGLRGRLGDGAIPAKPSTGFNTDITKTQIVPLMDNTQLTDTGGFDIMQFFSDNWIWIAGGVAAIIILPMILKKRR